MKSQARGQPISLLVFSLLVCKFSMKGVGEGLELGAVVGDRHVALRSVPELRFELESPMLFVVTKEVLDGFPDDTCRRARAHDDAEELGGDVMTHKYRGSQQSSREVKPIFIYSTQGEPKNIYKP